MSLVFDAVRFPAKYWWSRNTIFLSAAIYAYIIVKDNVTDDEAVIVEDLKMSIKKHIGSFAIPHCFMVIMTTVCL